ncbi:MAG: hypothetical protein WDZ68_00955, partial [Candidatus Paceibacterota bacterium]
LAIGLSMLNITLKQFTLSLTARDSEIAFHAANTGLECLQYTRNSDPTAFLNPNAPSVTCGGDTSAPTKKHPGGGVYGHVYTFDVDGNDGDMCIEVSLYTASPSGSDITRPLNNEGLAEFECPAGVTCTMIFSRGYNRACDDRDSIRTVQRELTIQF